MKSNISRTRLAHGALGVVVIVFFLWIGRPSDEGSAALEVSNISLGLLASVLSILAGFLMAVIAILGDHRGLFTGSWRVASAHARRTKRVLDRAVLLFYVYLVTISVTFISTILGSYGLDSTFERWAKHLAIGFGCAALIWSFGLPTAIKKALVERLEEEVDERKEVDKGKME